MTFLEEGYRLQEYEVKRALGQGGFGITYLAIDTSLEKEVAIKEFFPRELIDRDEITHSISLKNLEYDDNKKKLNEKRYNHFLEKFKAEARIMSNIKHPNIVEVKRIFKENNTSYFVMDFIDGESLKKYVKRVGSLTQEQIIEILMPILEGLKIVHSNNFLHRDIAPDNIILTKGTGKPMLIDFGAAKNTIRDNDGTEFSMGVIKNGYSAPEQHSDGSVHTASTDIYAIGAVIVFMISGGEIPPVAPKRLLYRDKDPLEDFLNKYRENYTQGFIKAILRAMSLNPNRRFQKISELQKALITKRVSLKEFIQMKNSRLDEGEICVIVKPLLKKLEGLHNKNSTHGNLSPESIYIKDKNIIELGRSKEIAKDSSKSLASIANRGYSAPEQYSADLKDTRHTDIYAVGAVMFFMLTNEHPTEATKRLTELYSGDDSIGTIINNYKKLYNEEFLEIITKAMSLNPNSRFKDVSLFQDILKKFETEIDSHDLYHLTINTKPSNANIKFLNIDISYHDGIKLKEDIYQIDISQKGYKSESIEIELYQDTTKDIELEKKKSNLKTPIIVLSILTILTIGFYFKNEIESLLNDKKIEPKKLENHQNKIVDVSTPIVNSFNEWEDSENIEIERVTWSEAKKHCKTLSLNGNSDWRLPKHTDFEDYPKEFKYTSKDNKYWAEEIPMDRRAMVFVFGKGDKENRTERKQKRKKYAVRCIR